MLAGKFTLGTVAITAEEAKFILNEDPDNLLEGRVKELKDEEMEMEIKDMSLTLSLPADIVIFDDHSDNVDEDEMWIRFCILIFSVGRSINDQNINAFYTDRENALGYLLALADNDIIKCVSRRSPDISMLAGSNIHMASDLLSELLLPELSLPESQLIRSTRE